LIIEVLEGNTKKEGSTISLKILPSLFEGYWHLSGVGGMASFIWGLALGKGSPSNPLVKGGRIMAQRRGRGVHCGEGGGGKK